MNNVRFLLVLFFATTLIWGVTGCSDDVSDDDEAVDTATNTDATGMDSDSNTVSDTATATSVVGDTSVCSGYGNYATCATGACATEYAACIGNTDCAAIVSCALLCGEDDTCMANCLAANPGGAVLAGTLWACIELNCAGCPE